jgi:hypothetical protein
VVKSNKSVHTDSPPPPLLVFQKLVLEKVLQERTNVDTLSMEELHGILTAYEMITKQENPITKETTFKASKKKNKRSKQKTKSDCSCNDDLEEDDEMENFLRKLQKETSKYKGMLPLKCFDYGGIGHFSSKCPHKNKESDEEEDPKKKKKNKKGRRNKNKLFKKILCTKEDSSSSDEDGDSDNDKERVLFMVVEDSEEEDEVDLREKMISSLEELRNERKTIKSLKEKIKRKEGSQNSNLEEVKKMISKLKVQVEEDKIIK